MQNLERERRAVRESYIIIAQRKNRGGGRSEEAAYKPRMVFTQSVVLNSQTTPPHAAALWFPQGFSVEFQRGRLVAISGLFHCRNRFWSANTKWPTKHPQNTIVFSYYKWKSTEKHGDSRPRKPNRFPKTLATKDDDPFFHFHPIVLWEPYLWSQRIGFDLQLPNFTIPFPKTKCMGHKSKIININITITISDLCKYPTFWMISRGVLRKGTPCRSSCCNCRNLVPRSQWRRKREQQQQQYKT